MPVLTDKLGPLPLWGWGAVAVAGVVVIRLRQNQAAAAAAANTNTYGNPTPLPPSGDWLGDNAISYDASLPANAGMGVPVSAVTDTNGQSGSGGQAPSIPGGTALGGGTGLVNSAPGFNQPRARVV